MTSVVVDTHINRLKSAVLKRFTAAQIAQWVTQHTKYAGQPYSYQDHEYQQELLNETANETAVQKCSQIGVSEASVRKALGLVYVLTPYTLAYTLPTAHFAGTFTKTRIDPVIEGSHTLSGAIHKSNNNTEVKQFGDSFLWIRGAASSNAPISIPCDHLIHDEFDFSDQEVLGQYQSRLTHSRWKKVDRFSTPTLPDFGINRFFKASRRKYYMCKCNHCNEWFVPDYYKHVKIPGYDRDLREIDGSTLIRIQWKEAKLLCPKCGLEPSLQIEYRQWVIENPGDMFEGVGLQISPFDAPNIIKPSYLVEASTKYDRPQDFVNFNLGLPAEDNESTLTRADFDNLFIQAAAPGSCDMVMGVDVGNIYHFKVGAVSSYGEITVVHSERVPMGGAKTRYHELRRQYQVSCTVMDSGPHSETVMALQTEDRTMFAGVYMRSKSVLTHAVVNKEENADEGVEFQRQVNINRNKALDAYMGAIRSNKIRWINSDLKEEIIGHHTSMKRVRAFDHESQDLIFAWQKTDGVDHFHHASLYMWIAAKIRAIGHSFAVLPTTTAYKFRVKPKVTQA